MLHSVTTRLTAWSDLSQHARVRVAEMMLEADENVVGTKFHVNTSAFVRVADGCGCQDDFDVAESAAAKTKMKVKRKGKRDGARPTKVRKSA